MSIDMDRPRTLPFWRKPAALTLAGVLVLAGGGAAMAVAAHGLRSTIRVRAISVTTEAVARGVFHDVTPVRAEVTPRQVVTVPVQEGGQIAQLLVQSGDVVALGQPLLRFRNTQLEMQVLERQSSLVSQISQLQASIQSLEDARTANEREMRRIDFDIARLTTVYNRQQALFEKGATTTVSRDQARDELDYTRSSKPAQAEIAARAEALRVQRIPEINAEIEGLKHSLEVTRAKLDNLIERAPAAGRLSDFHFNVGQTMTPGQTLGLITGETGFKLTAKVDQYYLGRVRPGQAAEMTLSDSGGARTWPAHVVRIDPQLKDGVFTAELEFDGAGPQGLITGQSLEGRLTLGGDAPAMVVGAGAWLDVTGGDWAMVLAPDGHSAQRRRIRIGRRNADQVEVLGQLSSGEKIITSSYQAFEKVDRVQLSK